MNNNSVLSNMFTSGYKIVSSTIRYVVNHPLESFTTYLYLQSRLANAIETNQHSGNAVVINDPALFFDTTNCVHSEGTFPSPGLLAEYDVISNVASFNDIQLYFLTEQHSRLDHHQLKKQFVSEMAKDGDVVLFEGRAKNKPFACNTVCITDTGVLLTSDTKIDNTSCAVQFNFDKSLVCTGWEDEVAYLKSGEILDEGVNYGVQVRETLTFFNGEIPNLVKQLEQYQKDAKSALLVESLKSIFKKIKHLYQNFKFSRQPPNADELRSYTIHIQKTNELPLKAQQLLDHVLMHAYFIKSEHKLLNTRNYYYATAFKDINKERNKLGLIETLGSIKNTIQKRFFFLGSQHLISEKSFKNEQPLDNVDSTDWAYAARKELNHYNHAIFIPKKRNSP